jgi:hypothetical protein
MTTSAMPATTIGLPANPTTATPTAVLVSK